MLVWKITFPTKSGLRSIGRYPGHGPACHDSSLGLCHVRVYEPIGMKPEVDAHESLLIIRSSRPINVEIRALVKFSVEVVRDTPSRLEYREDRVISSFGKMTDDERKEKYRKG